jgi:hypothetical protein
MNIRYENYGDTDNSNLKRLIMLLFYFILIIGILFGTTIVLKKSNKPVIIKKERKISTLSEEIKIIKETIKQKDLISINSTKENIIIDLRKGIKEKDFLILLIRYENYIKVNYNINQSITLKINKKVLK